MKYGLIGNPLKHSFSAEIHKLFGYDYTLLPLLEDQLDGFFEKKEFKGINVTIPYKEKVIKYLDYADETVKKIGACNTIVNKDGKLYGYNTDFFGMKAMFEKQNAEFTGKKALILGTGGTAKTAYAVLKSLGAGKVVKASRGKSGNDIISYDEAVSFDPDIIVNTTPVGMFPETDRCPVDISLFKNVSFAADVIYNPLRTLFVQNEEKRKINACGGLYMLFMQGAAASELFTGNKYSDEFIREKYRLFSDSKLSVALTGMPGAGKTTAANLLSGDVCDTDVIIKEKTGLSPKEIITSKGEEYFRDVESVVIKEISDKPGKIISTGGGAVLREENILNLKKNCCVVYLFRDIGKIGIYDDRPLAKDRKMLEKVFRERKEIYENTADIIIRCSDDPKQTAERIKEGVKAYEDSSYQRSQH